MKPKDHLFPVTAITPFISEDYAPLLSVRPPGANRLHIRWYNEPPRASTDYIPPAIKDQPYVDFLRSKLIWFLVHSHPSHVGKVALGSAPYEKYLEVCLANYTSDGKPNMTARLHADLLVSAVSKAKEKSLQQAIGETQKSLGQWDAHQSVHGADLCISFLNTLIALYSQVLELLSFTIETCDITINSSSLRLVDPGNPVTSAFRNTDAVVTLAELTSLLQEDHTTIITQERKALEKLRKNFGDKFSDCFR